MHSLPPAERLPNAFSAVVAPALTGAASPVFVRRARLRLTVRRASMNVLDNHTVLVSGALLPAKAGRELTLKVLTAHGWRTRAHTYTGARGRFTLRFAPRRLASMRLEVRYAGDSRALAARRVLGRLTVYRLADASWYGGGGGLACGGYLTSSTMGVANKTLPCGTQVTLRYGGHSVRVPVVDRGPYVAGREFDLTEATKRALGFEGVGEVWSSR